ncbi:MAG: U32 family peptidase [Verrucomicrobiales bacterium]|nr:U32 family peptidase [Verrucomicrobiales bacterium]
MLAPAGDWECAKAAVENGADAIYFGLDRFNARMRARNFTAADLPKLMAFLHGRGVKGYVTFNTLVFANELDEAEQYLRSIIAAGVDAVIAQDVGICRLIRRLSPDFPIHASTQMTITSAAGVEFAKELGCQLVVLARECSLKEIEKIQAAQTDSALRTPHSAFPLEVFVHGALCVAYSGQCLTSEALGGRSANRGECAQACRMPYELISDGQVVPLGDKKYLLSPQDLAGLEVLPELIRAGVASLKIEGRLKSPEYVANITRIYRQALDQGQPGSAGAEPSREAGQNSKSKIRNPKYEMEMAFSRGLYTGWFRGINNQQLVHARFGKKRGVYIGEVTRTQNGRVFLDLVAPLKPGDGVVFDSGHPEENEEGGRVYEVQSSKFKVQGSTEVALAFAHGAIDFARVHVGDKVWKTSDPELDHRLRQTFAGDQPQFQQPLEFEVHGCADQPLTVMARDEHGHIAKAASRMPLAEARNQPLTIKLLRHQLGRLGGTPFKLGALRSHLEGAVILPMSELNRLRRELVSELETLRAVPKRWSLQECGMRSADCGIPKATSALRLSGVPHSAFRTPHLIVLVRSLAQLEAALSCKVETLYCEFEDPKKYREAVARFRAWQSVSSRGGSAGTPDQSPIANRQSQIFIAPPRICKMGEDWILRQVRSSEADGYLVRNYDHLKFFAACRCIGDFSLNIANELTAHYFKSRFRLERVTASYDLNITQLEALLRNAPPEWFEITIHQHMPMFHMEHCVFCAFLSQGTDFTNCGRPCDQHEIKLRDRVGAVHPLKADAGCRNTVFHALAQTGAESVGRMLALGARHFRIEFVNETAEQIVHTISAYQRLLRGELTGTQLWRDLKLLNQLGVTRGQINAG